MAWLRSKIGRSVYARAPENGWKMLEMQLNDGDGTFTIKTRRKDDHMAVSVGFSDAKLRHIASSNVNQLQNALQAQYDAPVDFSLMSDGSGTGHNHTSGNGSDRSGRDVSPDHPEAETDAASHTRAALMGAQHEWVG